MLHRLHHAVWRIGIAYIYMMVITVASVIYHIMHWGEKYNWNGSMFDMISGSLIMAFAIHAMWRVSKSTYRSVISVLMVADTIVDGFLIANHRTFGSNVQTAIDVLWIMGIAIMYTGPKVTDVVRDTFNPSTETRESI